MIELNHKCSDHPANTGFNALPVGTYACVIEEIEKRDTKAKDGSYLSLKIKVIKGEYTNRLVFTMLHLWNKNEQAVQIAQGTLTAIGESLGIESISNAEELLGKPINVTLSQRTYNGEQQNEVKAFTKYDAFTGKPAASETPADDSTPF